MSAKQPAHLEINGESDWTYAFAAAGFDTVVCPMPLTKFCRRLYDCEPEDENGECICPRCEMEFSECDCIGTDHYISEFGWPLVLTGVVPDEEREEVQRICQELQPRYCLFSSEPPPVELAEEFAALICREIKKGNTNG